MPRRRSIRFAALLLFAATAPAHSQPNAVPESRPADSAPPTPDYSKDESWAATARSESAAARVAPGAAPRRKKPAVDIFYVHPTTDRSQDHWNQDIADATVNLWTDQSVIARQAGAFNRCCRIFAPRYRQATRRANFAVPALRQEAFAIAYGDVLRAFEYYLAHDNRGRPFILVGHSQGAAHIAQLLEERIDGTPLADRMVAAYIVGIGLMEGAFGRAYKTIDICAKPDQTGCAVHWNSILPTGSAKQTAAFSQQAYIERYGDVAGNTMLCVNPLTFDRGMPAATSAASKGAVPGAPDAGAIKPLIRRAVSARCSEEGLLIVEPSTQLALQPLDGGSMHYHDIGLFYEDIRQNADLRSQAFLKALRKPRTKAPARNNPPRTSGDDR